MFWSPTQLGLAFGPHRAFDNLRSSYTDPCYTASHFSNFCLLYCHSKSKPSIRGITVWAASDHGFFSVTFYKQWSPTDTHWDWSRVSTSRDSQRSPHTQWEESWQWWSWESHLINTLGMPSAFHYHHHGGNRQHYFLTIQLPWVHQASSRYQYQSWSRSCSHSLWCPFKPPRYYSSHYHFSPSREPQHRSRSRSKNLDWTWQPLVSTAPYPASTSVSHSATALSIAPPRQSLVAVDPLTSHADPQGY